VTSPAIRKIRPDVPGWLPHMFTLEKGHPSETTPVRLGYEPGKWTVLGSRSGGVDACERYDWIGGDPMGGSLGWTPAPIGCERPVLAYTGDPFSLALGDVASTIVAKADGCPSWKTP
jgi:hypothetical protein